VGDIVCIVQSIPVELVLILVVPDTSEPEDHGPPHKKYAPFHATGPPPLVVDDCVQSIPFALYSIVVEVLDVIPDATHT
jgi:hypothetical protein